MENLLRILKFYWVNLNTITYCLDPVINSSCKIPTKRSTKKGKYFRNFDLEDFIHKSEKCIGNWSSIQFLKKSESFSTQFRHLWEENLWWNIRNFYIWNFWWKTLLALQFFHQVDWLTRSGIPTCSCQIITRNFANLFSVKVLTMIWPGQKAQKTKNPRGEFPLIYLEIKVSKNQKHIFQPKLLPKNEPTNLFFYPDGPDVLETCNWNFKFQVFPDH